MFYKEVRRKNILSRLRMLFHGLRTGHQTRAETYFWLLGFSAATLLLGDLEMHALMNKVVDCFRDHLCDFSDWGPYE